MFQQPYGNYYPQYNMNAQQRLQQMEQQYPQFSQQPAVQQNQNVTWIPVSGVQGAKDHIVQPGQTVWMMDNNAPVFYVKSADQMGTSSFKAYRFEEIQTDSISHPSIQIDTSKYVLRDEFDQLKAKLEQLTLLSENNGETIDKEA